MFGFESLFHCTVLAIESMFVSQEVLPNQFRTGTFRPRVEPNDVSVMKVGVTFSEATPHFKINLSYNFIVFKPIFVMLVSADPVKCTVTN